MADKWAVASGNWSNPATWNGGVKPGVSDDVYADGKTVTVDEDATVASVRTTQRSGGTLGGGFVLNAGVTISADVIGGSTHCVSSSQSTGTVIGAITGGTVAGGSSPAGVYYSGTGLLTVVGNVTAGTSSPYAKGCYNASTGRVSIVGNVTGSNLPYYPSAAVYNHSTGTIEVTGTVRSTGIGYGIQNNSSGAIAVAGDVYAGPNLPAIVSLSSAANVRIDGSQYGYPSPNGTSPGIVAVYSPSLCCVVNQLTIVQFARAGGASPVYETGESVTYYGLAAAGVSQASPADVRSGTVYGPSSELEGTLAVPAAGSVAMGVPVDATVGTAILTAALVRAAVGLAEANLDAQFAAITVDPQSIRDAMKLAPSAGAAAANSIDSKVEDRATPAAVAALLAAALDAP